jgi:hypothetical protein
VSGLHLPPAGEPDQELAAAVAALKLARDELREAHRVRALLQLHGPTGLRRREIELQVAELRIRLWSNEVRRTERDVVAHGGRP